MDRTVTVEVNVDKGMTPTRVVVHMEMSEREANHLYIWLMDTLQVMNLPNELDKLYDARCGKRA